jgi:hypothetical protein
VIASFGTCMRLNGLCHFKVGLVRLIGPCGARGESNGIVMYIATSSTLLTSPTDGTGLWWLG